MVKLPRRARNAYTYAPEELKFEMWKHSEGYGSGGGIPSFGASASYV